MTDAGRAVVWRASYDPFGRATVTSAGPVLNLRLPGQYFDAETGLHYNMARHYDPGIGRYLQSDPIGLEGGVNTYGYVENNPLLRIDPLGLFGSNIEGGISCFGCHGLPDWFNPPIYDNRSIPMPDKPKCGCTCTCRADANDNIPGNIKPGDKAFAFGTATAGNCSEASKEAKRIATHSLGKQPKHVGCRCNGS